MKNIMTAVLATCMVLGMQACNKPPEPKSMYNYNDDNKQKKQDKDRDGIPDQYQNRRNY